MKSVKEQLLTYLDEVLDKGSSKLVGKVCKRFEILDDKESIKREVRELIYEWIREMRDIFYSYGYGLEMSSFNFIQSKSKEK